MTTANDIDLSKTDLKKEIERYTKLKKEANTSGGEWSGACPFCGGKDRFRVWLNETPQRYWCRGCDRKGDIINFITDSQKLGFFDTLAYLGISADGGSINQTLTPQEYAGKHGLEWADLERMGFKSVKYQARPAIEFPTKGGKRWRFLDGKDPRYTSEQGFKQTLYGFDDKLIAEAETNRMPLFWVNGEFSAIASRFNGIPAFTLAGGGEHTMPDDLLKTVLTRWKGKIAVCFGNDPEAQKSEQKCLAQLGSRAIKIRLTGSPRDDIADFCTLHGVHSASKIKSCIVIDPQSPITHRQASARIVQRLDSDETIANKPISIPYRAWHEFGGYARVGMPGMITAIVGVSGGGKTSVLNTMIDTLLQKGEIGLGIMPEFTADEYHYDRLQRYSSPDAKVTTDSMMLHEMYKKERSLGIPHDRCDGVPLSHEQMNEVRRISQYVSNWAGTFELVPYTGNLAVDLNTMGESITFRRELGELVTFSSFDYLQILKVQGESDASNDVEQTLSAIKQFAMQYQVHVLLSSQSNKDAVQMARMKNRLLSATDMNYAREDVINLMVTMNLIHDDNGLPCKIRGLDAYAGIGRIVKNNKGRSGKVKMIFNYGRLMWEDIAWTDDLLETPPAK